MRKLSTCIGPSKEPRPDILAKNSNSILKFIPEEDYRILEMELPDNLRFVLVEFEELGYQHLIMDDLIILLYRKQKEKESENEEATSKRQDRTDIPPTNTGT